MLTESIEQAATSHPTQIVTSAGTVAVANTEKIAKWYDPAWDVVWGSLPWQELATVIGVIWIGYSMFAEVKAKFKSK